MGPGVVRGLSRRELLALAGSALLGACEGVNGGGRIITRDSDVDVWRAARQGRLVTRPGDVEVAPEPVGLQPLGIGTERDGLVYVPAGYTPERPWPLVVMLHGAGSNAQNAVGPFLEIADAAGLLLLAPDSRGRTWDVLLGGYGPDVVFLNQALDRVFARYRVDPARMAIEGFSDGASYALGLGLTNGELFTAVVAFSPGFLAPTRLQGMPPVFVSHGIADNVLPITPTSRRIVPQLEQDGYDVHYVEFDGGHAVPARIAEEALRWLQAVWAV